MFEQLLSFLGNKSATPTPERRPLRLETLEARVVLDATILSATPFPPALLVNVATIKPEVLVLRPVAQQQDNSLTAPVFTDTRPQSPLSPSSVNNGAVWATLTSVHSLPTATRDGTRDTDVRILFGDLAGDFWASLRFLQK